MSAFQATVAHRRRAGVKGLVVLAGVALALSSCSSSSSTGWEDDSAASGAGDASASASSTVAGVSQVRMAWWHNSDSDPMKTFFQKVADDYHAKNPNVTIEVSAMGNEDVKAKLPVALQSPEAPAVIQQWGGGWMADQVKANRLMDLTSDSSSWIGDLGATVNGWQLDGKTYGVPYTLGIVGFWYNKDLFAKAGITTPPTTWDGLIAASGKLKAAGLTPIAIGAKDKWPTAFWYDYLVVRECSQQTLQSATSTFTFDDPCWVKAGEDFKKLVDAGPFQPGFQNTPAQGSPTSSAGLLANGKAAMELMGHWNPAVMSGLTADKKGLGSKLGWFPFPAVTGGKGAADAALGGGDGYSCSANAPKECVDFLKYLVSTDVQTQYAALNAGLPTNKNAVGAVTDANLKDVVAFRDKASFIQTYLDVAFGSSVGNALNDAVSLELAGSAKPQAVVKAMKDAAASR